ncbi:MAG: winged helix-turn-helix transcriptional regulator [Maritimibacter sp.]|nr:winged helix-turn-helix transcriptional regulator [Maritimibacter sp.]
MSYAESIVALADPTRRQLFELLAAHPGPVGALAEHLPVSRPAVSQHLKVLSEAGLVTVRAEGTRRIYAVRREGLAELRAWIDGFWDDVLAGFEAEVLARKGNDT